MESSQNISVIIAAAGNSSRLKENKSKLFVELLGKPLIFYSIEKLLKIKNVKEVIVVTNDVESTKELLGNNDIKIVLGASTRQESVFNGFNALSEDSELVLIHDVARPLFDIQDVENCIKDAAKSGAAILSVPVVDTIKKYKLLENVKYIEKTINREYLYKVQTPQIFKYSLLKKAYESIKSLKDTTFTDESMLFEELSMEVVLSKSSDKNLKITFPEDLKVAEALLKCEKVSTIEA